MSSPWLDRASSVVAVQKKSRWTIPILPCRPNHRAPSSLQLLHEGARRRKTPPRWVNGRNVACRPGIVEIALAQNGGVLEHGSNRNWYRSCKSTGFSPPLLVKNPQPRLGGVNQIHGPEQADLLTKAIPTYLGNLGVRVHFRHHSAIFPARIYSAYMSASSILFHTGRIFGS